MSTLVLPARYRIKDKIGEGGMGVVYHAFDANLHLDVAIKVLHEGTFADDESRRLFRNEALAMTRLLDHRNIAVIRDFDCYEGTDFLVLEHIDGRPLDRCISNGPLALAELLSVAWELAEGLAYAHAQGVIHRDLKPGNLILRRDGRLKILDFGLAKRLQRGSTGTGSSGAGISSSSASRPESFLGTLQYAAPEQLRGEALDARADIYAFGATLFHLATGRLMFEETDHTRLVAAVLERKPPRPSTINSAVPPELEAIIVRALEKDPSRRYASAEQLLRALGELRKSAQHGHRHAWALAAFSALTIAAGVIAAEARSAAGGSQPGSRAAIEIESTPTGALVLLDGVPTGLVTPARIDWVSPDRAIQVEAQKPGYAPARQRLEPPLAPSVRIELRLRSGDEGGGP